MTFTFDQRIDRAAELAKTCATAAELLIFYGQIARVQKRILEDIGEETDVRILTRYWPGLVSSELLLDCWEGRPPEDPAVCVRARWLLQPFAESLAMRRPIDPHWSQAICPFCSSNPVVAVLRGEGDGAKRWLLCSLCATEWPYRRIVCHNCGEENKDRLPVYTAGGFDFVRIQACDSCKTYIKAVDLTKNGLAVPVVDEIATVSLNIWAEQNSYTKLEPNLLGM